MGDPTNRNDPQYANDSHYVWRNGRWQYTTTPSDHPEGGGNPSDPTDPKFSSDSSYHWDSNQKVWAPNVNSLSASTMSPWMKNMRGIYDMFKARDRLGADAPGAELNTTQPDAERQRMQSFLTQLQGQAATGGGAWESALASATGQANSAATALGQSTPGLDRVAAARNVGNAVAGNNQRAIGEGNILRAQTQQEAQRQLGDIYGQQTSADASQSASQAAARQARLEANQQAADNQRAQTMGMIQGGTQAIGAIAALSKGGTVPGSAETFGDSEENDTVPTWLSPGEIVLPRSVTKSANPEAEAAAFVAAVKNRPSNKHNFDGGGNVGNDNPLDDSQSQFGPPDDPNPGNDTSVDTNLSHPNNPFSAIYNAVMMPNQHPASQANGALLDTTQYNQTRDAALANAGNYLQQYAGTGPSVAPQATQSATDETLAAAMRSGANARGMGRAAGAGDTMQAAAEQGMKAASRAGETVASESTKGAAEYAQAVNRQRAQDLAFAQAQQQAEWRNSLMNAGIGLQQQAQLRGLLSGAGQAAASITGMLPGEDEGAISGGNAGNNKSGIDSAFDSEPTDWTTPSAQGDWNTDGVDAGGNAAHGGEIGPAEAKKAAEFVKALRSRKVAA